MAPAITKAGLCLVILTPLSVLGSPVNQRDRGDLRDGVCPRCWLGAADRSRGQGGAPTAQRGRTTLASVRAAASWPDEDRDVVAVSVHGVRPLPGRGVMGVCVRAPSLIWVHGPIRTRRQDDRWGIPQRARPRGLLGSSTPVSVAAGAWQALAAAHLWCGRARTDHVGQAASDAGSGRPSAGTSAASPSASRVCRTRRASLRATAKVARLPPWRSLTCW
jgi:hypothetical protein